MDPQNSLRDDSSGITVGNAETYVIYLLAQLFSSNHQRASLVLSIRRYQLRRSVYNKEH